MSHRAWRKITDGTEQKDRLPLPLRDGYFRPDERSFADLLAFTAELAGEISFYDLDNRKDGTWRELFLCDEAVVIALILTSDTRTLERRFLLLARGGQLASQGALVYEMARSIDTWYRRLEVAESARAAELGWHILTAVEKGLAAALHSLGAFLVTLSSREERPDFTSLHRMWGVATEGGAAAFPLAGQKGRSTKEAASLLHDSFRSFLNAVSYLKQCSRKIFQQTLQTGNHDPALGLFMAFLRLFQRAQDEINSFTGRHRDFYYRQLLGFVPRKEVGDSAYLIVHPDGGDREIFIPQGTAFSAGKDGNGGELFYSADADTALRNVHVRSLCTLYLDRDPLVSPERELGFVTGAYAGSIPVASGNGPSWNSYALFGERSSRTGDGSSGQALLGFAVASPVLFLAEGRRDLAVTVRFMPLPEESAPMETKEGAFFSRFGKLFSRYLLAANGEELLSEKEKQRLLESAAGVISERSLKVIKGLLRCNRQDIFFSLFRRMFTLAISVETGWHEVHHPSVTPVPAASGLRFAFELGPEAPPVVAGQPSVHGFGNGALPLLRFAVNPKADFYPYSLFAGIRLRDLSIDVRVRGVTDLTLYNNHGQLDPSKPFNPFGPLPTSDSYLIIGNYEMARKKLHSLAINLEWGELPRCRGGFREHYRAYGEDYGNEAFLAQGAVLRGGEWRPLGGAAHRLFATGSDGSSIAAKKRVELKGAHLFSQLSPGVKRDDFRYDQRARNGFIRLGLSAPESAFGHGEYSHLLTRALVANSTPRRRRRELPLPNPPYTPVVSALSIDYTARAAVKISSDAAEVEESIYHLHPFGAEKVYPSPLKSVPLLTEIPYDGNLFIGLSCCEPGPLSLFFHLKKDTEKVVQGGQAAIAWFYLAGNRWRRLRQVQISSDSTEGFLSSGVVTLEIPQDISCDNSVMPPDRYWLRLSARGDLSSFCSLYSVRTGAIQVTRRPPEKGGAASPGRIPPGTIREAAVSIPGVEKVSQPLESFGGRGRETPQELTVRSSERLRHKQRAVLAWDYERLILEHFPDVLKVKCFSNLKISDDVKPAPGHVLIVVVPRMKQGESEPGLCPQLNAAELSRIHARVSSLASPFAKIEVRNPAYELIRVVCSVKLKAEAEAHRGIYLKKLNQAVIDFISPWNSKGYQARFGWCIRRGEVESFLLEQGYVDMVTGFSLLHVVADQVEDGLFSLFDTARGGSMAKRKGGKSEVVAVEEVCPRYPWSLAMPTADHTISLLNREEAKPAEPTGLNRLQLGQTLIVGG